MAEKLLVNIVLDWLGEIPAGCLVSRVLEAVVVSNLLLVANSLR